VGEAMGRLRFEELTERSIHDAVDVCNASLVHDFLNPSTLRRITFRDPNCEPSLALVAYDDGEPLGFAVGCRRIREPAELVDPTAGSIKILAGRASENRSETEVLDLLCEKVETELRRLGATTVRLTDFASWHIWAGIDVRYETILEVLEKRGYLKVGEAIDYLIGLGAFSIPRRVRRLREHLEGQGISIAVATLGESKGLCSWVKEKFSAAWAYEVATSIENAERNRSGTLVAKERTTGETMGFSTHGALEPNWFGPIGVDERKRRLGVGTVLLFESLRLMRLNGVANAVVPWTSDLFFYTQVPGIIGIRHYHTMSKGLG